ncbi:CorA family divalent cation transporter [Caloramator sp. Dgby_cultured_2]|uniref:CorA family divalent cation transporter n=1 Tax=Caloramator sp. Dgby_cultured_2 TaxID=3029174 RepID=UPI003157FB33
MIEFLRAPLDEEESSRIEVDGEQISVIIDIPIMDVKEKSLQYYTIPLGIVLNDNVIVTICLKENKVIDDFLANKVKSFLPLKNQDLYFKYFTRWHHIIFVILSKLTKQAILLRQGFISP